MVASKKIRKSFFEILARSDNDDDDEKHDDDSLLATAIT